MWPRRLACLVLAALAHVQAFHVARLPTPTSRAGRRRAQLLLGAGSRMRLGSTRQSRQQAGDSGIAQGAAVETMQTIAVNRQYRGLRQIHRDPDIFTIDNFFDKKTCEAFLTVGLRGEKDGSAKRVSSKVFGSGLSAGRIFQGALAATASALVPALREMSSLGQARKSTTWFLNYGRAAPLVRSVLSLLPDARLENCEEPQVVRYKTGDYFDWHEDALPPQQARRPTNGGQRVGTVLVYLNDMGAREGGATEFRDLPVSISPVQGKAVLFFPAFADGTPDPRTVHAGKPVTGANSKWIAQLWIHQGRYVPSVPPGNSHTDFTRSGGGLLF